MPPDAEPTAVPPDRGPADRGPADRGPADVWPAAVLDLLATDRVVFEDGDRHVTGHQMLAMIRRIAAGLRAAGVRAAGIDAVVLRLGVTAEAFAAIFASFAVGARVAGVRADQLDQVLPSFGGEVIDDARLSSLAATPDPGTLVLSGRPDNMARVLYTSGSTGVPKGCAQTYASMTAAWAAHPSRWPPAVRALARRLERYLVFGSLTSQVMLEYGVLTLAAGGVLVVARPPGFPGMIARHRATASVITVGKLHQLVRDQRTDPADLGTLRALLVSGSPLAPARLAEALDVLGPVVFHGYGQTETGMIAMATPEEMLADPATLATVGRPPVEVDIRDGELFVRTPAQASSYWRDPSESAEVFVDGWIRTRDLASLDPGGYLHLLGRARDVIIVHAELVYAGPIERALAQSPDVAEAYVTGRPDDLTGEAVHAFVVPAAGRSPDPEVLRKLVATALPPAAIPATITMIDRVPLSPSGKPDKSALQPVQQNRAPGPS